MHCTAASKGVPTWHGRLRSSYFSNTSETATSPRCGKGTRDIQMLSPNDPPPRRVQPRSQEAGRRVRAITQKEIKRS